MQSCSDFKLILTFNLQYFDQVQQFKLKVRPILKDSMHSQGKVIYSGNQQQQKVCSYCNQKGHIQIECPYLIFNSSSSDQSADDSYISKSRNKSKQSKRRQDSQKSSDFNKYLYHQFLAKQKKELEEEYQRKLFNQSKSRRLSTNCQKRDGRQFKQELKSRDNKQSLGKDSKERRVQSKQEQFQTIIIPNKVLNMMKYQQSIIQQSQYAYGQNYNFQSNPNFRYPQKFQFNQKICRICNQIGHNNHYCQICGDPDSDHRARNCPYQYNHQIQYRQPYHQQRRQSNQQNVSQQFAQVNQVQGQQKNVSCKVAGCIENHNRHYCKICKKVDSDHFARNCPMSALKAPPKPRQMNCKVAQCKQQHHNHFCNVCENKDSDHRSKNCPNLANRKNICKVRNCYKDHQSHFCKVCQDRNSDHKAKNCPKGQEMYHGTTEQAAKAIMQSKFQPSKNGNLGAGIYFTPVRQAAVGIAKLREKQNPGKKSVLIIAILRKVAGNFQERIHGPWAGAYDKDFVEICVTDDKYMRIKSYQIV